MSENETGQNRSTEKKGGIGKVVLIIGLIIIIVLLVVIVVLLLRKPQSPENPASPASQTEETGKQREVLVNEDNIADIAQQLNESAEERVQPGRYTAMMNFEWHFATGDSESTDSYVANSIENTNDVYFDLFLADDLENAIYESPVIPRGKELRNIRLKTDLNAGTYDCILVYHLVDEKQNTISTASFTVKVIVER
jgi:hypothetical protein